MVDINKEVEKGLNEVHLQLNDWLIKELIIGLEKVNVEVIIETDVPKEMYNIKTILKIINNDSGKIHCAALNQELIFKEEKEFKEEEDEM